MQKILSTTILPVKNGELFISQALLTLSENLTAIDELIVVDDGSSDATPIILSGFSSSFDNYKIVTIKNSIGPAAARNSALLVASGSYISFLDHDDLWPEGRLERHLAYLQNNPGISAVVGKTNYEFEGSMSERAFKFKNGSSALHHVHLGAATFRKEVFERVGFFNETLRFSEDHEFFLKIREQGHKIYFDPEVSLRYRVHGKNMSLHKSLHELGMFQILADSIKRRRIRGRMSDEIQYFGQQLKL